ncbi:opioid-binding protein/cell adhesion molecule homolog [Copidosoma floridanum]|uniref:opioid-binding protein/cell adhesion molecule homolog n=1 Tax=Copidosoma floridanum TaxID=29053 RepID=UPI0006C968EE|nr:opioid-binding protein/cell adhesion molecule homolog [Copidosoma floridanum]
MFTLSSHSTDQSSTALNTIPPKKRNSGDPNFKAPITNVTAPVGREVMLSCTVQDLGGYKVAWLRVDTQTILTIASHVITKNHRIGVTHSEHRTWFLHIKEVKETDRGWYMCQINTDPMKSTLGYLDVVVPPDIIDYETSTDQVVREGTNVSLRCSATGSPLPTITWRREDGKPIVLAKDREVQIVTGSIFNLTRVNRQHMGPYLCIASNAVPPTVSKRINLIVQFPPMIWIPNQLIGAREGQTIVIECISEAFPKSINYWTRDKDEIVPQGGKYETSVHDSTYKVHMKLTIRNVDASDFGSFKCVSRNSLGDTDGTIKLYRIAASSGYHSSDDDDMKYKGKQRKNSGNSFLEGNQDRLKEKDPNQRSGKEGEDDEDYGDSGVSRPSPVGCVLLILLLLSFCHQLHLRPLHPA